jgi:alpha-mannosidase
VLNETVYSGPPHVKLSVWHAPGTTRPTFREANDPLNLFQDAKVGDKFGPSWSTHWFKVFLSLPQEICGRGYIELHWDCENEATVWTENGLPLQGLTGRGERVEWIIPDSFRDGEEHIIYIEMACNGMFGNGPGRPIFKNNAGGDSIQPPDPDKYFQLSKAEIVAVDFQARMLHMDIVAIYDAATEFSEDSWQQHKALSVATKIINTFQASNRDSIQECRRIAQEFLGPNINSTEIYRQDNSEEIDVFAIGHCHIDTCWLWPWAETKRKVARSWLNQCDLMERYPELRFACSQAQQFKWLKEEYPYAWDRVKAKVAEGKFHPIGGCWVEHDTNLPSGESLVRQFLYGQRFFESNFGARSTTLWLPDTFGFAAQLPQLSRQAGMNRFLTQKICFNNINEFPHTTFNWVALDGSQVISHMPPVRTYTAEGTVADVKKSVARHLSMDQDHTSLMAFGKGDGGGGPTWQHLERLRRCRGIADTVGLLPKVHLGNSVDEFFDGLEKKADSLVTWHGELYFELHRGVYTTQSKSKLNNRKSEFLLRDIELLATIASVTDPKYKYPKKELDGMWESVLLCQFHDCLPGTSIKMCYDNSEKVGETNNPYSAHRN